MSNKDLKTIELLELLDKYQLIKSSNRNNFINGFLNLSRANFQNDKIRYGIEKFDLRCYQACKIINLSNDNIDDQFQLIDRFEENKLIKKSNKEDKDKHEEDEEESILRNRKEKKINEDDIDDDDDGKPIIEYKDPIKQFGGIVPQELRKSQINFNNALIELIEIINLIKKIEILINELNLN